MANTLPIQRHNILVYHEDKFIGYVQNVISRGTCVICHVGSRRSGFNKRRAESIKRSADVANICELETGTKLYNRKDNLKFKMVGENNNEYH